MGDYERLRSFKFVGLGDVGQGEDHVEEEALFRAAGVRGLVQGSSF